MLFSIFASRITWKLKTVLILHCGVMQSTICAEEANGLKFPPGNSSFQGDWYPPHLPQLVLIPIYSFPLTAFSDRESLLV